jgi:hypothetical protein
MRINLKTSFLVAGLLGLALGATKSLSATEEEQLPNQCYHQSGEPNGTCSICGDTCLGTGYKCCKIVT